MILVERLVKQFRTPWPLERLWRAEARQAARRTILALDGIDLRVAEGEVLGLMGENGAGKSTFLRLLSGLLSPTSGRVEAAGLSGPLLRTRVGYVFSDERSFSLRLSVRENLAFFGALHGLARREALRRGDGLLERVGLGADATRPYRELSTGMRQRAALARGLLGDPAVLLFDEPTRGIDPAGALALRELIADQTRGRTAIVATHHGAEAERLCKRVIVLAAGRIVAELAPSEAEAFLARGGAKPAPLEEAHAEVVPA